MFGVPVAQLPPRIDPRHTAKIVRHLHERWPDWTARDGIGSGVLHGNIPAADVDAALASLVTRHLAERRTVATEGRPREEWRPHRSPAHPFPCNPVRKPPMEIFEPEGAGIEVPVPAHLDRIVAGKPVPETNEPEKAAA